MDEETTTQQPIVEKTIEEQEKELLQKKELSISKDEAEFIAELEALQTKHDCKVVLSVIFNSIGAPEWKISPLSNKRKPNA